MSLEKTIKRVVLVLKVSTIIAVPTATLFAQDVSSPVSLPSDTSEVFASVPRLASFPARQSEITRIGRTPKTYRLRERLAAERDISDVGDVGVFPKLATRTVNLMELAKLEPALVRTYLWFLEGEQSGTRQGESVEDWEAHRKTLREQFLYTLARYAFLGILDAELSEERLIDHELPPHWIPYVQAVLIRRGLRAMGETYMDTEGVGDRRIAFERARSALAELKKEDEKGRRLGDHFRIRWTEMSGCDYQQVDKRIVSGGAQKPPPVYVRFGASVFDKSNPNGFEEFNKTIQETLWRERKRQVRLELFQRLIGYEAERPVSEPVREDYVTFYEKNRDMRFVREDQVQASWQTLTLEWSHPLSRSDAKAATERLLPAIQAVWNRVIADGRALPAGNLQQTFERLGPIKRRRLAEIPALIQRQAESDDLLREQLARYELSAERSHLFVEGALDEESEREEDLELRHIEDLVRGDSARDAIPFGSRNILTFDRSGVAKTLISFVVDRRIEYRPLFPPSASKRDLLGDQEFHRLTLDAQTVQATVRAEWMEPHHKERSVNFFAQTLSNSVSYVHIPGLVDEPRLIDWKRELFFDEDMVDLFVSDVVDPEPDLMVTGISSVEQKDYTINSHRFFSWGIASPFRQSNR